MQTENAKRDEAGRPESKRILGRLLAQELTEGELSAVTGALMRNSHNTCCMGDGVVYCFDDCG